MNDMKELITAGQINTLFTTAAVAGPILGAVIGTALGARRHELRRFALIGLLIGLAGPANLILWKMYNGITDKLGLDTVKNLIVNLALFAGLGAMAGVIYGFAARQKARHSLKDEAPD